MRKIFKFQFLNFSFPKRQAGMTLFIAIIIMSVLLFVTFAVANISVKSSLFAYSGRESQLAFYAADTGIECAIYWDTKFDTSKFDINTPGSPINCVGNDITNSSSPVGTSTANLIGGGGTSNPTSVFSFLLSSNTALPCAVVTVTKNADGSTYIKSRGYNTCDTSNPRRMERGVEVTY